MEVAQPAGVEGTRRGQRGDQTGAEDFEACGQVKGRFQG
jgi:hypothetical protein